MRGTIPCPPNQARGPQDSSLQMGPQSLTLGLGVQIPGHQLRTPCSLGEEQKGRRLEKCELKPLDRTFCVAPPSLPNANQVAKLRRRLCPLCRERRGGQEPQRFSVPRKTWKPQPSPPAHLCLPSRSTALSPQEPGAIPSCSSSPGLAEPREDLCPSLVSAICHHWLLTFPPRPLYYISHSSRTLEGPVCQKWNLGSNRHFVSPDAPF